jgi:hypothetical protein
MMKMNKTVCALLWLAMMASAAWAQGDPQQAPGSAQQTPGDTQQPTQDDSQRTPPPAAFGPESAPVIVNENPPISGLDQPSLEPNFQPRSMLVGGVEGSESLDSNIGSDARPAWHSVTRGLGGLTMQRLWRRYQLAAAYVGGAGYYNRAGDGWKQIQKLQAQQSILWRTGQLTMRDSFSYLPEGSFGYGSYGGSSGFQLGLGGLGEGMGILGTGFLGHTGLSSQQIGSLGQEPRITNSAIVDVVQGLSPRSSVTAAGAYEIVHFTGDSQGFINSRQAAAQAGYSHSVSKKNQVALSYGFQSFHFPSEAGAENVTSHVVQAMFGHRVSGRMDLVMGAGPQWTRIEDPVSGSTSRLSVAGHFTLRYQFPRTAAGLSFERYDTSGSGFFAGAVSNIARLQLERKLGRHYSVNASLGFSHNQRLQEASLGVPATSYNYGFAGIALRRQIGYNWGAYLSYQWNDQVFDTCPVPGQQNCDRISVRHVVTIGVDWHFRPIRID